MSGKTSWRLCLIVATLCLLGLTFTPPAHAQTGPVAGETCTNTASGSVASVTCTFSSALTANDLLYICIDNGNGTAPTWSGDSGTFVSELVLGQIWDGGLRKIYCFHVLPLTGGGTTITATGSGGNFSSPIIFGAEFAGITSLDVSGCASCANATGNSGTISGQSITTTSNGDLIVSMIGCASGGVTAGSGYTSVVTQGGKYEIQYRVQSSAGSIQATGTCTSGQWVNQIASFKVPTSAPARHRLINN